MNYPDALFDAFMYPLEAVSLTARRRQLMPLATGDVLEIGTGTGVNFHYYDPKRIRSLTATDLRIAERARERAAVLGDATVRLIEADAMSLPFAGATFDAVVITLVFCSVPDQRAGFAEIRRVLRPGGRLLFIEHVRPHGAAGYLTDLVNPLWHAATGECNVNRDTPAAMSRAGFELRGLQRGGGGFLIHGVAVR